MFLFTVCGAVSFHTLHTVENRENRRYDLMNVYQQIRKIVVILCPHVPRGFFKPHYTSEGVFHSECHNHLGVGLQFWKINHLVRFKNLSGNFYLLKHLSTDFHGVVQRNTWNAQSFTNIFNTCDRKTASQALPLQGNG